MSTYECSTVGCTLGDCPNCRYVATHASNTIEDMRELARAAVGASSVDTGDAK
jgi:hypothetical protein